MAALRRVSPAIPIYVAISFPVGVSRRKMSILSEAVPGPHMMAASLWISVATALAAIAQTVTGLTPGQTYNFSFAYARHLFWGTAPLTADVIVNGAVVAQLTATTANYPTNWLTMSIPVVAPANGKITLGFRSTALDTGGGVVVDDIKLSP